ncbi:9237_t:CDS:2, partial [Gigaspora rosea]
MATSTAPQELNILLLGESGAGKSTFINALANYFKFNSLDDAISGKINVLISSKFTITNEDYETKTITIDNEKDDDDDGKDDGEDDSEGDSEDDSEDDDDDDYVIDSLGESSTKECGVYKFKSAENKVIRFIDTPGIGDTRGIEYDKQNFENILKTISHYEYLNGICILLKPNNSRLNIIFKYCIQELLAHLHKNAKDNIVFCFTNTRETFFRPGDTLPVLKKQLDDIKKKSDIEIKICKDTIYCFDNDSFRFLAAIKKRMIFTDDEKKSFIFSWEKSTNESIRLLQHIIKCKPHQIKETVSLNNARQIIKILYKPLAEEPKRKLYIPHIELESFQLPRPRVKCTNNNCDKKVASCHVKWKKLNTYIQKRKGAMKFGKCKSCSCPVKSHKVIFYESKSIKKNKILEDQVNKQNYIEILQKKIDELQEQQNTIDDIIIKFTQFLSQSTITTFNDSYAENLDYIINFEKSKFITFKNYNNEILEGLEETKRKYDEKIKTIMDSPSLYPPSFEDIFRLEQQLYSLPDIGKYLQVIKTKEKNAFKYQEKHKVFRNQNHKLSQILGAFKNKRGFGKYEENDKKENDEKYGMKDGKEDKKDGKEKEEKNEGKDDFFKTDNSFNINNIDNSCSKTHKADDSSNNKTDNSSTHKANDSFAHKTDDSFKVDYNLSSKINKTDDDSSKINDSSRTNKIDNSSEIVDNSFKADKNDPSSLIDKTDNSSNIDDSSKTDTIDDSSVNDKTDGSDRTDDSSKTDKIDDSSDKTDNSFKTDKTENSSKVVEADDSSTVNDSSTIDDSSRANKIDSLSETVDIDDSFKAVKSENSDKNDDPSSITYKTDNPSKIDDSSK